VDGDWEATPAAIPPHEMILRADIPAGAAMSAGALARMYAALLGEAG